MWEGWLHLSKHASTLPAQSCGKSVPPERIDRLLRIAYSPGLLSSHDRWTLADGPAVTWAKNLMPFLVKAIAWILDTRFPPLDPDVRRSEREEYNISVPACNRNIAVV